MKKWQTPWGWVDRGSDDVRANKRQELTRTDTKPIFLRYLTPLAEKRPKTR
jgi:hypothetical protein